ncbi:MAG: hypothetical protein ACRD40_05030 [Candidatus Acidiferrales bacterium]
MIRDRNLPVANIVPLSEEEADDQELKLVAEGKMRRISSGTVAGSKAIEALFAERETKDCEEDNLLGCQRVCSVVCRAQDSAPLSSAHGLV